MFSPNPLTTRVVHTPAHRSGRTTAVALMLTVALVGAACSSDADTSPTASDPASTSALLPLDTAAMDQVVDDLATGFHEIGMLVLIRTPAGDYTNAWGTLGIESDDKPTVDTRIRVGSNTKTWTGTAIMQMVQEGKISVDDPVGKYRPDVPNGENITIGHLLDMRSGLYNYTQTLELNTALDEDPQRVWTPEELLALAFENPPYSAPGTEYHYSNTNTVLLGLIAEALDGKPLAQIFEDRFFSGLGMAGTSFPANTDTSLPVPYVSGYSYSGNVETLGEGKESLPPERLAAIEAGTARPRVTTNDNPSWTWAAGQGISSANDLAIWVKALGNGRLLDAQTQQLRMDSIQPSDPDDPTSSGYGYGIAQMGPLLGHIGEMPGYNSFMGYDPVNDVTMVVWGNLAPTAEGFPPAAMVAKSLVPYVYAGSADDTGEDIDDAAQDAGGG